MADDPSDGVWLIRSLNVRCSVGCSASEGELSELIARQIAGEIGRVLGDGADGLDVLWFPSRAAFLGRYLADFAAGRVSDRWEYAEFSVWAGSSCSSVVRELALSEPLLDALANMLPGELKALLRQVLPEDAGEVLSRIAAGATGAAAFSVLLSVAKSLLEASELPRDSRRAALFLFLFGARQEMGVAGREFERICRDFGEFAEEFLGLDSSTVSRLTSAVETGDWSDLPKVLGGGGMAQMAGVLSWPKAHVREVQGLLSQQKSPDFRSVSGESLSTRFGGMFLLLPLLAEFPWEEATVGWASCCGVPAARMAQYLTVIGALGQRRNPGVASDTVLRLALGIEGVLDRESVAAWAVSVDVRRFWRVWLERLITFGKISLEEVTLFEVGRGVLAVDSERGIWVGAGGRKAVLASIQSMAEPDWVSGASMPDVEFALLSPSFGLPLAFRRLTMLTAQSLVREMAWRLPGFARSSMSHVFENFLDFPASVEVEEDRYLVHLHKPPLHLVLSMTGMARKQFRMDATGGKEWVLTQAQ